MHSLDSPVRIDKWLWAARFFKTRGMAVEALKHGQVRCNGVRPKPSRVLKVGDKLNITRGEEEFDIEVLGLAERRGPASEARQLYQESADSVARREARAAERRAARLSAPLPPQMRPDKHARQRIRRLLGK